MTTFIRQQWDMRTNSEPNCIKPSMIIVLLTPREREVIILLSKGFTSKEIGKHLFISIHTVLSHKKALMKKLKAKNSTHLIALAYQQGHLQI